MDKEQVLKRFQQEVAIQRERYRTAQEEVNKICQQLGLDPNNVSVESVDKVIEDLKSQLTEQEVELEKLVKDYDEPATSN